VLGDGSRVVVRPFAGGDVGALQETFDAMSERSRYQRFLAAKPRLTQDDLRRLAAVDHEDHEALIALDPESGRAIGDAHLVRDRHDRRVADVAVAVADAWQSRSLGTRLVALLAARARELGIERFRASMFVDNDRSRRMMRRVGRVVAAVYEGATIELEIALD
jgi:RimJ/RimL family protein N-acetyltransferase